MHPLIARLDGWLRERRPDYYAELRPGARPDQLARIARLGGGELPPPLAEFLAWRDGDEGEAFEYNRSLMGADSIVEAMETLTGMAEGGEWEEADWWRREWVPFLSGAGGDHVCVDLGGAFGGKPGQVLEFWHADEDRPILHPSFEAWLETRVEAFEAGMFALSEDGNFEPLDNAAHEEFVAARNPGYPIDVTLR